ncbi:hypothetical protein [Kineococcus arenarius]|uniref:hypothetical protein n=1 Tax=unclassified Kineococcus TaxID=2621656 RepID=UPI003D7E6946
MRVRQVFAAAGALAVTGITLGVVPTVLPASSAAAGCAGPQLVVGSDPAAAQPDAVQSPAPVPIPASGQLQVAGQWFHEGCDDTGVAGAGCAGPVTTSQSPMEDVDLVLEQAGSSWTLGTAGAAGHDEQYAIAWQVRLPEDVAPGPAVLSAAGAEVPVLIEG